MSTPVKRKGPEMVTFAVSALLLTIVVGLLVWLAFQTDSPASPTAGRPGPVREAQGQYYVPVEVTNHGDQAAAEVQVVAELTVGDRTVTGDQVIDFLGGGEAQLLTFAFADDPATGELTVVVTGFSEP